MYENNHSLQLIFPMGDILLLSRDIGDHVAKLSEIVLKIDVKAFEYCALCVLMG